MLEANGDFILMVDADGATKFSDLDRLEEEMLKAMVHGLGVVVGSRAHLQEKAVATVRWELSAVKCSNSGHH